MTGGGLRRQFPQYRSDAVHLHMLISAAEAALGADEQAAYEHASYEHAAHEHASHEHATGPRCSAGNVTAADVRV